MAMKIVEVDALPNCCRCEMQGGQQTGTVRYDTRVTTLGTWGYLCQSHFTYEGDKKLATKVKARKV